MQWFFLAGHLLSSYDVKELFHAYYFMKFKFRFQEIFAFCWNLEILFHPSGRSKEKIFCSAGIKPFNTEKLGKKFIFKDLLDEF